MSSTLHTPRPARRDVFVLSLCAAILAIACVATPSRAIDVDPSLEASDAATLWRWIGKRSNPSLPCPSAGTWTASPLFDPGDGSTIPPTLRPFCLYQGNPSEIALLEALVDVTGELTAVESDSMAVAGLGHDTLVDDVWVDLANHFLDQAGYALWPTHGGDRPGLAVLDTSPTDDTDPEIYPGSSRHGHALLNMAKNLLCDGSGDCLAEVTSRLTLPYTDFDPSDRAASTRDDLEGGYVGTLSDLATAIRGEIHARETSAASRLLVINLSLGWNSLFGGDEATPADMPVPVQAIYEALRQASCRGALVVVAAGNDTGGPDLDTGPLYPAAWEQHAAPSFRACRHILGEPPNPANFPALGEIVYRPLVYAVGGVDADGDPLANGRQEARPRLVAFADHATTADAWGSAPTDVLTGTSVSSLVVSAAAAAVAYYRHDLRADEVMATLYDSGDDLAAAPDFCLGGAPCPDLSATRRRVSVCRALTEACQVDTDGACPASADQPACPTWPSTADLDAADLVTYSVPPWNVVDLDDDLPYTPGLPASCGLGTLYTPSAASPTDPCPQTQYYGVEIETWLTPQPRSNPCPGCWGSESTSSSTTSTIYVEIDPDFEGDLTDATLVVGDAHYNLGLTLTAGDTARLDDVPPLSSDGTPVALVFTVDGEESATAPVLVVADE